MRQTKHATRLALAALALCVLAQSARPSAGDDKQPDLIFEGTLEQIGPEPETYAGSIMLTFQIAKYRVRRSIKGKLPSEYVVIDTLYTSADAGLKDFSVGDTVCVRAWRVSPRRMSGRTDVPGIREPAELVKYFYLGGPVRKGSAPGGCVK